MIRTNVEECTRSMKKFIGTIFTVAVIGLGVGAAVIATHISDAKAITVPYSQQPRIALYNEAGLNVAAGAIIQSAVFPMDRISECTVLAENSAGGSARTLNIDWMDSLGTTVIYRQAVTVALATRQLVVISPTASTASLPATVVAIPATTGKKMQFTLAAAGAAVGSLVIICQ